MAPVAIILVVALFAATLRVGRRAALPALPVAAVFGIIATYVAVRHLPPALGNGGVGETLAKLAMLALVLWLTSAGWPRAVDSGHLRTIALFGLAGLAVGAAFLLVELLFDAPIHRLVEGLDAAVYVDASRYNRPAVALLLLSLPLAGLLARQVGRSHAAAALALGVGPAMLAASAAGWLAAAVAAVAYASAREAPRAVLLAGGLLTAAFVIAAPLLLPAAYRSAVERGIEMPLSFTHRLEIWDHAAGAVAEAPLFGTGLGSVKHLPMTDSQRDRYRVHKAPSTHGHNAAIQVWVEFGAVGIAAGLALLGIAARAIGRIDRAAQPVVLAATAALLVIAMLSFGLWQETWLGMIAVTVLLIRLASLPEQAERAERPA